MKISNLIMPYSKGKFIVIGVIYERKRSNLKYLCMCGKVNYARSDSRLFLRDDCGMCFNEYSMIGSECHIDVYDSAGDCKTLKIDRDMISLAKNVIKGKVYYAESNSKRTNYAYCTGINHSSDLFHRVLFDVQSDMVVDHIDGDGLNCLSSNVRVVDRPENNRNLPMMKTNTSGVVGVAACSSGGFRSYIWNDGKQVSLGSYDNLFDAVSARKSAEIKYKYHSNHGRKTNSNE